MSAAHFALLHLCEQGQPIMQPSTSSSPGLGPDPFAPYPVPDHPRIGFLKPMITHSLIEVGDYSYYDDPNGPEHFQDRNVLYHFDFLGDRLVIGKFCAIAQGVTFIMNGANHMMGGISTYPFAALGGGWDEGFDIDFYRSQSKGNTVIGDDVWIGRNATILPGVSIGSGSIIGAGAMVGRDVPAYGVVAGNPAELVRMRFDETQIDRLMAIGWWDWPIEQITRYRHVIQQADIEALEAAFAQFS